MHLVMFDIDGTLVDSSDFEDECYQRAIEKVISRPVDTDWSSYAHATDSGILDEIIDRHRLGRHRDTIHRDVKSVFSRYVASYLAHNGTREIEGAGAFLRRLKKRTDVVPAIATGGWEETAKMKLDAAGINSSGIAFASGSDRTSRTEIMKTAENRSLSGQTASKTYFGDAAWDREACRVLGYHFILVGSRIAWKKQIHDFSQPEKVLSMIGLDAC